MSSLIASLPVVELAPGASITLEALDPTTGAPVGGVQVSNVNISTDAPTSPVEAPPSLPPMLAHAPANAKLDSGLPG